MRTLCASCGQPPEPGKRRCLNCKEAQSERQRQTRKKAQAQGLCTQCLKKPADAGVRCRTCADNLNAYLKDRNAKARARMLTAYGGRCACCGETYPPFLAIDHIHGDGSDERKNGGPQGTAFFKTLEKAGWPKDRYQLLCHCCNHAKRDKEKCPCGGTRGKPSLQNPESVVYYPGLTEDRSS